MIEKLIAIIADANESDKHNNVSEFFCDLIQHGRAMRQTENENDSFEAAFEGSNPVLKMIESRATLEALFNVILQPNATESTIVPAITVVLKIIKPTIILLVVLFIIKYYLSFNQNYLFCVYIIYIFCFFCFFFIIIL